MELKTFVSKILSDEDVDHKLRKYQKVLLSLEDVNKKGKSIIVSKYEEFVTQLQKQLQIKPLLIKADWKNEEKEEVMFAMKYHKFREEFEIVVMPTWSEIGIVSKLYNEYLNEQINDKIKNLTQPQSVVLIENVLSDSKIEWIKDFRLNPKASDDEGTDFTAVLYIDRDGSISHDEFGKWVEIVGQLKHLKGEMGPSDMRDFIGTIKTSKKKHGMVISTNGFTKRTIDAVDSSKFTIFCYDSNFITDLIIKHKIGMKEYRIKAGLIPDDEWWDEIRIFS
ncbi:restriction endonuclease [Nitrosopumilus zosterae]|uniref:restriction endonuclease n=1 Tax=Nitrosopumilus zosterae TaxID=718286 RepID=UPI00135A0A0B|nr:restriction endonuclease [Nitrosopumilus zosterae]